MFHSLKPERCFIRNEKWNRFSHFHPMFCSLFTHSSGCNESCKVKKSTLLLLLKLQVGRGNEAGKIFSKRTLYSHSRPISLTLALALATRESCEMEKSCQAAVSLWLILQSTSVNLIFLIVRELSVQAWCEVELWHRQNSLFHLPAVVDDVNLIC